MTNIAILQCYSINLHFFNVLKYNLNLSDTAQIAGANSEQAQQPGGRCTELPPGWHGLCDAEQSLQPPAAPHLGRDGPKQDKSGGKGTC